MDKKQLEHYESVVLITELSSELYNMSEGIAKLLK